MFSIERRLSVSWFLVVILINSVTPIPLQNEEELREELKTPGGRLRLFVEKVRVGMQEHLTTTYEYLTPNDFSKALEVFNEFEERFSNDLDSVLIRSRLGKIYSKKKLEDGLPDSAFDTVKQRIKHDFPRIGENAADELMFRLRRNLMWTRFKLDVIVRESKTIQNLSSEEE